MEKARFGGNTKLQTFEASNRKSWSTGKKKATEQDSKWSHLELWIKALDVIGNFALKCSESATLKMLCDKCLIAQEYKYVNVKAS